MAIPKLNDKIYRGVTKAYGENFIVEIAPSKEYPGYYHVGVTCLADKFVDETKRPILESGVEGFLQYLLKQHGLVLDDLHWSEHTGKEPVLVKKES